MSKPDYPYIANLAKEIAAPFEDWHESEVFAAAWVQLLAGALMMWLPAQANQHRRAIEGWCRRIQATEAKDMRDCLQDIGKWIEAKYEMDDGCWPEDPYINLIYRLSCAMLERTRWLAQAGGDIGLTIMGFKEVNNWLLNLYAQAAQASRPPLQTVYDESKPTRPLAHFSTEMGALIAQLEKLRTLACAGPWVRGQEGLSIYGPGGNPLASFARYAHTPHTVRLVLTMFSNLDVIIAALKVASGNSDHQHDVALEVDYLRQVRRHGWNAGLNAARENVDEKLKELLNCIESLEQFEPEPQKPARPDPSTARTELVKSIFAKVMMNRPVHQAIVDEIFARAPDDVDQRFGEMAHYFLTEAKVIDPSITQEEVLAYMKPAIMAGTFWPPSEKHQV